MAKKMLGKIILVIADRGFVFIGREAESKRGEGWVRINNAVNLRKWDGGHDLTGVAGGLDQKLTCSPLPEGGIEFHELSIVAILDCIENPKLFNLPE